MRTIGIKHRWTNACLWTGDVQESGNDRIDMGRAVVAALKSGADLRDADLRDADLRGADLRGAVLSGAVLRGAYLRDADLTGAVLRDAVLSGADLRGAVLSDADLSGAVLRDADLRDAVLRDAVLSDAVLSGADLKVKDFRVFSGLYSYTVMAILHEDGTPWVRMGCLWKTVEEWDRIGIRASNPGEFPNDGSERCEERARAFEFARAAALRLAEIGAANNA